jgi:hypothetical protein
MQEFWKELGSSLARTATHSPTTVAMLDCFPAMTTIRPEFSACITPCVVIMHKVYWGMIVVYDTPLVVYDPPFIVYDPPLIVYDPPLAVYDPSSVVYDPPCLVFSAKLLCTIVMRLNSIQWPINGSIYGSIYRVNNPGGACKLFLLRFLELRDVRPTIRS